MERLWPDTFVGEGTLTRNISDLRKALGEEKYMETVPKEGYRFVASVREIDDEGATLIVEKTTEAHLVIEDGEEDRASGEMERIGPPGVEGRPYSTSEAAGRSVRDSLPLVRTADELVASNGAGMCSVSSAEYLLSAIKRHKRGVAVALLVLLVAALGIGYWFFVHRSSNVTPIESIAVLPFVNEGGTVDVEYLSDGITESLINNATRVYAILCRSRRSPAAEDAPADRSGPQATSALPPEAGTDNAGCPT